LDGGLTELTAFGLKAGLGSRCVGGGLARLFWLCMPFTDETDETVFRLAELRRRSGTDWLPDFIASFCASWLSVQAYMSVRSAFKISAPT